MSATTKALDFTNVKERTFNPKHIPAGDYRAKVVKAEDHTSKAGNPQWLFTVQLADKRVKTVASYPYYCGLDVEQLWKVRSLFAGAGITIPKKKVKIDPNRIVGRFIGVTLEDDEYEGKLKSVIAAIIPESEIGDADEDADEDDEEDDSEGEEATEDEDEDEAPPPPKPASKKEKTGKAKKPKPTGDDDELEELDIEDI